MNKALSTINNSISKLTFNKSVIIIGFLALVTRLYKITVKELWIDEVLGIQQVQKPLFEALKDDSPVFLVFNYLFNAISSNIIWLRIPTVLFGVASVILFFYIIRKIANEEVAFFSAFMLAISPMLIEFSQQILHYSYFVFFTLLTLYYYFDLVFENKFELPKVFLFICASLLNLASQPAAFLVLLLQFLFFILYSFLNPKISFMKIRDLFAKKKNPLFIIIIFCLILIFILTIGITNIAKLLNFSRLNSNVPIPLGYSLTAQLKTVALEGFTLPFYKAMFAWFGNGGGYQLIIFLSLFIAGLLLLLFKKFWVFLFSVVWIGAPFAIINFTRTSHWFEEKYLIFLIPIYLFTISYAVVAVIRLIFKSESNKNLRIACLFITAIIFLNLSLAPIDTRTTYGYKVRGDPGYSWRKALDSIQEKMGEKDILMTPDDDFLSVYFGNQNRNKTWLSEEDIIPYTPEQYMQLVRSKHAYYYLSIADVVDMKIGKIVTATSLGRKGGFNLYKIDFQKSSPVNFKGQYVENFMKMDYLKEASNWSNVLLNYYVDENVAYPLLINETNSLYMVPKSKANSFVTYKFKLKPPYKKLLLRVNYLERKSGEFFIELTDDKKRPIILRDPIKQKIYGDYFDQTFDLGKHKNSKMVTLIFKFRYLTKFTSKPEVGLKSFGLLTNGYVDPVLVKTVNGSYKYDAGLEAGKNKKWWIQTVRNFGWVQSAYGILYRTTGTKDDALEYKFLLPKNISKGNILVKNIAKDNTFITSISNDGLHYTELDKNLNEVQEIEHNYALLPKMLKNQSNLYVRFQTEKMGRFAALKAAKLILK